MCVANTLCKGKVAHGACNSGDLHICWEITSQMIFRCCADISGELLQALCIARFYPVM